MKLFVGNDYTFCLGDNCDKKDSCMRWIEHYEWWISSIVGLT
jgi:hypothetical protein